jgi:hypothetical protein
MTKEQTNHECTSKHETSKGGPSSARVVLGGASHVPSANGPRHWRVCGVRNARSRSNVRKRLYT